MSGKSQLEIASDITMALINKLVLPPSQPGAVENTLDEFAPKVAEAYKTIYLGLKSAQRAGGE